uniref:Pyrrolidone-carboxylate peptidase n=2 Tax=Picocystis salinarum TaxID=88271 RepID=A0A6U9Q021_9CHLO|mmetsp:Transcript_2892/g.18045  ORF Transcript_2892/g.18045 Transcript_2892/m.18045 type:complete len:229 (+) Transcript_2892:456-1142(+)
MEDQQRACVVVTGFGPFQQVRENPTQWIVQDVKEKAMHGNVLAKQGQIVTCAVLDVVAKNATECVDELVNTAIQHAKGTTYVPVLVHFGVDTTREQIHVERRAYNEADFRCPDNQGWQPKRQVIDEQVGDVHQYISTTLPVEELVQACRKKGYHVHASDDAGRFVCNWTYFQSLRRTQNIGYAIFVHVPPEHTCPIEMLQGFAWDFLNAISAYVATQTLDQLRRPTEE